MNGSSRKNIATGILITAAVCLIAVGIVTGEQLDVMQKAVNICLECIGVG